MDGQYLMYAAGRYLVLSVGLGLLIIGLLLVTRIDHRIETALTHAGVQESCARSVGFTVTSLIAGVLILAIELKTSKDLPGVPRGLMVVVITLAMLYLIYHMAGRCGLHI